MTVKTKSVYDTVEESDGDRMPVTRFWPRGVSKGTIVLPLLVHFGWAKPVPVNFSVLSRSQIFKVAAAGPAANMSIALLLAAVFHLFHLHAIPMLGNFVLLAVLFNIMLAVFNVIPILPLDGSKMVYAKLSSQKAISAYAAFSRFGMLAVIVFLFFGGFRIFVLPVVAVVYILLGLPLPALVIEGRSGSSKQAAQVESGQESLGDVCRRTSAGAMSRLVRFRGS